ncbi:MAG: aminomethyltransferase family protein [Geminicoccaceae bacterium]
MGETAGWERPNWYAPEGVKPVYEYSYGRQNWFEHAGSENAGRWPGMWPIFELRPASRSSFVKGRDALAVLNRLSSAELDVEPGRIVYTLWLNELAGSRPISRSRLAGDEFLVVATAAGRPATRPASRKLSAMRTVSLSISPRACRCWGSWGHVHARCFRPSSALTCRTSLPFGHSRMLEIGYAPVRVSRVTYVGELGYELYVEADHALHVFERIVEAGGDFGLRHAGYHAMNACRVEKGYRHWGHDMAVEDNPFEAGLGFTVAFGKKGGFIGREALLPLRDQGPPKRRLVHFRLDDDDKLLYHEEPIWLGDRIVGSITSGMYGHRVGASLGMGYASHEEGVTKDFLANADFEIEIAWKRFPAKAQLQPFYDPLSERVRS